MFNKANKGKITIAEEKGEIKVYKKKPPEYLVKKGVRNPDFPYKRIVMCPHCEQPLFGSALKGRLGKYYPAYHCNKRGHYFRVLKKDFDDTIKFVKNFDLAPGYTGELVSAVIEEWDKRQKELHKDDINIYAQITELKTQAKMTVDKIRFLTSEVAIKCMEEDLIKTEEQIANLLSEKEKSVESNPVDMNLVMEYIKYFLEHMDYLLLDQANPVNRAGHFGVLLDKAPTYQEILSGTADLAYAIKLNEVFVQSKGKLAAGIGRH